MADQKLPAETFKALLVILRAKNVDICVGEGDVGKDEKIRAILHKDNGDGTIEDIRIGNSARIEPKEGEKVVIEGSNLKPGKKLTEGGSGLSGDLIA